MQYTSFDPRYAGKAYANTQLPASSSEYQEAHRIAKGVLQGIIPDPIGGATEYWNPNALGQASQNTLDRLDKIYKSGKFIKLGDHIFSLYKNVARRPFGEIEAYLQDSQSPDEIDRLRERERNLLLDSGPPAADQIDRLNEIVGITPPRPASTLKSMSTNPPGYYMFGQNFHSLAYGDDWPIPPPGVRPVHEPWASGIDAPPAGPFAPALDKQPAIPFPPQEGEPVTAPSPSPAPSEQSAPTQPQPTVPRFPGWFGFN